MRVFKCFPTGSMDATTFFALNFIFAYYPYVKPVYRQYEHALVSARKKKNAVQFLKNCLDEQVCPKYLGSFHHLSSLRGDPFPQSVRARIDDEIFQTNLRKECDFSKVRSLKRDLQSLAPPHLHNALFDHAKNAAEFHSRGQINGLKGKLRSLCKDSIWEKMSNRNSVKNISRHLLSADEQTFLGLGLSFSMEARTFDVLDCTRKLYDLVARYQQGKEFDKVKHTYFVMGNFIDSYLAIINEKFGGIPKRLFKAATSLKRNKSIRITKSDKGNSIVIIDHDQYLQKARSLLGDSNVYLKLRSSLKYNTSTFKKNFCVKLRKIASHCPDPSFFNRFEPKNNVLPPLPHFYGLVKTHKENHPLRPIIAARNTVTHSLSKWLNSYLKPLVGTFSDSHIMNNVDFIAKVRDIPTLNHKLVSFDVEALFTNVPFDDVLDFLRRKFSENTIQLPIPAESFLELLKLCVSDNVFCFGKECYRQISGIAMGNCLSPVLANLYMEYFETELLPTILPKDIKCWFRYVDDIFCIWPSALDPIFETFFNQLNNLSPSVSFTVEWESNSKLPFLDVLVHNVNGKLSFSVYRKPTHSGGYLHYFSKHPQYMKLSVAIGLFLRIFRISSNIYQQSDIDETFEILKRNGYPEFFLQKALAKAKFKSQNPAPRERNQSDLKRLVVPYHESFDQKKWLLKSAGIELVFNHPNTIKKTLIQRKLMVPKDSENDSPGLYIINCNTCPMKYIGETGRTVTERLKEHKMYLNVNARDPGKYVDQAVVKHRSLDHAVDIQNAGIIYRSNSLSERLILESLLISKLPNFNNCKGKYSVDPVTQKLLIAATPRLPWPAD